MGATYGLPVGRGTAGAAVGLGVAAGVGAAVGLGVATGAA